MKKLAESSTLIPHMKTLTNKRKRTEETEETEADPLLTTNFSLLPTLKSQPSKNSKKQRQSPHHTSPLIITFKTEPHSAPRLNEQEYLNERSVEFYLESPEARQDQRTYVLEKRQTEIVDFSEDHCPVSTVIASFIKYKSKKIKKMIKRAEIGSNNSNFEIHAIFFNQSLNHFETIHTNKTTVEIGSVIYVQKVIEFLKPFETKFKKLDDQFFYSGQRIPRPPFIILERGGNLSTSLSYWKQISKNFKQQ